MGASKAALANLSYDCQSRTGTLATLEVAKDGRRIHFSDHTHSASTAGIYQGTEDAPYSRALGFRKYLAVDYAITADSVWYLKIDPSFNNLQEFKLIEVFDNDGHEESETEFKCRSRIDQNLPEFPRENPNYWPYPSESVNAGYPS